MSLTFTAIIPLIVCLVGLALMVFSLKKSPDPWPVAAKVAEHMYWTGLLVTLFALAHQVIRL